MVSALLELRRHAAARRTTMARDSEDMPTDDIIGESDEEIIGAEDSEDEFDEDEEDIDEEDDSDTEEEAS
jgi:hypothetical protein